jgi:hypothetical protein
MPSISKTADNLGLIYPQNGILAIGGDIIYDGGYKIHIFTSTGTFLVGSVNRITPVEYLVVAGGGGGGIGGNGTTTKSTGGGAGGLLFGNFLPETKNYTITVGSGGASSSNGGNSSISGIVTSTGGGGGGDVNYTKTGTGSAGSNGGSGGGGGGGGVGAQPAGVGIVGQGFNGSVATGDKNTAIVTLGAGGGAGGPASGELGGPGITTSISGISTTYAKGGNATVAGGLQPNNTGNGGIGLSAGSDGIVILRYKYP